jgi:hypothetical protein
VIAETVSDVGERSDQDGQAREAEKGPGEREELPIVPGEETEDTEPARVHGDGTRWRGPVS